jgi:2-polyprenyl-3-methyl-5-hydroxy-6-metoxy-1,4-benzoquinol methylase
VPEPEVWDRNAQADDIEYSRIDATDEDALRALGEHRFDAVTCLMALMDIADLKPLARNLPRLLAPGGRFVFVTAHPAFNSSYVQQGRLPRRGPRSASPGAPSRRRRTGR